MTNKEKVEKLIKNLHENYETLLHDKEFPQFQNIDVDEIIEEIIEELQMIKNER